MFDPRSIAGLDGGWIEFRGMSFSLHLSIFDNDPEDPCKYEVGRFFNICFWYIFPGEAAIVDCYHFPKTLLNAKEKLLSSRCLNRF